MDIARWHKSLHNTVHTSEHILTMATFVSHSLHNMVCIQACVPFAAYCLSPAAMSTLGPTLYTFKQVGAQAVFFPVLLVDSRYFVSGACKFLSLDYSLSEVL